VGDPNAYEKFAWYRQAVKEGRLQKISCAYCNKKISRQLVSTAMVTALNISVSNAVTVGAESSKSQSLTYRVAKEGY
jgi:hypothetical protein